MIKSILALIGLIVVALTVWQWLGVGDAVDVTVQEAKDLVVEMKDRAVDAVAAMGAEQDEHAVSPGESAPAVRPGAEHGVSGDTGASPTSIRTIKQSREGAGDAMDEFEVSTDRLQRILEHMRE